MGSGGFINYYFNVSPRVSFRKILQGERRTEPPNRIEVYSGAVVKQKLPHKALGSFVKINKMKILSQTCERMTKWSGKNACLRLTNDSLPCTSERSKEMGLRLTRQDHGVEDIDLPVSNTYRYPQKTGKFNPSVCPVRPRGHGQHADSQNCLFNKVGF